MNSKKYNSTSFDFLRLLSTHLFDFLRFPSIHFDLSRLPFESRHSQLSIFN
jgi:hypothetical protein